MLGILTLYRRNKETLVGKSSSVYNSNELAKTSALLNLVSLSDHIVIVAGLIGINIRFKFHCLPKLILVLP